MQRSSKNLKLLSSSSNISTSKLFFWLLIFYFCLPNYEFSELLPGASGLKTSDFISLIIAFFLYKHGSFKVDKMLLFFSLWYLIKGILSFSAVGLLFGARFIEYIVVVAAAYNMNEKHLKLFFSVFTYFLIAYFIIEAIFIFLGLGSPFSIFNSGMTWQGRFTSIFGGPYELGAIALLLLFIPGVQRKLFYLILLLSSQARASVLGLAAFLFNPRLWIFIIPISFVMFFLLISRFDDLINLLPRTSEIFQTFRSILGDFSYSTREEYILSWEQRGDIVSLISIDEGRSSLLRIYTYILILSGLSDPFSIIFGYYPGVYGVAVDSSILRIFGETGIIGLTLFVLCMAKQLINKETFLITTAFIINLALVDIYFSNKAFTLFWIIVFYLRLSSEKKTSF